MRYGTALSTFDSRLVLGRDCLYGGYVFFFFKLIVGPQGIAGAEISADDICGCKSAEFLSLGCPGGRKKRQLQGSHLHSGL